MIIDQLSDKDDRNCDAFDLIINLCGLFSQSKLVFPELKLLSPRLVLDALLPEIEDLLFLEN